MSYNNGVTINFRRTQGPARSVRSMGSAGTGGQMAASGETAIGTGRSDDMVDDHDPLDAQAALVAADEMMRALKTGGAR